MRHPKLWVHNCVTKAIACSEGLNHHKSLLTFGAGPPVNKHNTWTGTCSVACEMRNHGHLKRNYSRHTILRTPNRNKVLATSIAPITPRSLRIDSPHPRCRAPASANSRSAVRVLEHPEMLLGFSIACIEPSRIHFWKSDSNSLKQAILFER